MSQQKDHADEEEETWESCPKPVAFQRGPKTEEENAKLGTVKWSVEEQRGLQRGTCGEGAVHGRGPWPCSPSLGNWVAQLKAGPGPLNRKGRVCLP